MANQATTVASDSLTDFHNLVLQKFAMSQQNKTSGLDLTQPMLRPSLKYVYPLFIFLHACVCVVGFGGNGAILIVIVKRRLYRNPTFFFICNLAFSDFVKAAIVAPITVTNLLIENFIFGSFMCFFLPMMQSFPIHASMLTYTMIAVDRYRFIMHPMKYRVPAGLCTIAVWVVSVCVVLPYAAYIQYIDLNPLGVDIGMCTVDHQRGANIEEYVRAMFVIFYCLPLAIIAFLYVRISAEVKANNDNAVVAIEAEDKKPSVSGITHQSHLTWSGDREGKMDMETSSTSFAQHHQISKESEVERMNGEEEQGNFDIQKEKRTQKYLIVMVLLFAVCWFPLTIIMLATHIVREHEGNQGRIDIMYLIFTFFGYISTCTNPVLFASWFMTERTKNRLRGYFHFSNRQQCSGRSAMSQVPEVSFGHSLVNSTSLQNQMDVQQSSNQ